DGDSVVISVRDTGTGIPESARAHVFEPFFTTKEIGKGTGHGLALVWSVVKDKHGGEITFDTVVGQGTTFYVRLPVAGKVQLCADIRPRGFAPVSDGPRWLI
ncbi:MAG TPA: HAMP domain-containing sensor histidine kinase, partial [Polyangiaceae bacterium]